MDDEYELLAAALDALPNGFARTTAGLELRILRKIFSPDEAELACRLTGTAASAVEIAARVRLPAAEVARRLPALVARGLVRQESEGDVPLFRLAPFMVGIFESQSDVLDHELAHLVEGYMAAGGAAGIMQPEPALHRVLPAQGTVKSEWILPYEDVRALLLAATTYNAGTCICRAERELVGQKCAYPRDMCLSFSTAVREWQPGDLTRDEALALLDRTEELGLVHTVSNVMQGVDYVCNCCGCCCAILRGITEWGIKQSVAAASYYAVIDEDLCAACGTCVGRCQVHAIAERDGVPVVSREQCIGCGLCASGCPNRAARLERKAEAEHLPTPVDRFAWEDERARNRAMAGAAGR